MAKITKLLGAARGRVGGLVFSKGDGGENYVRSYQPVVYNPKTTAQKIPRAKMNLAGRLSGVTPPSVLAGLSGENRRQRRSRFSSILLKAIFVDMTDPAAIVAKIDPSDVVFSEGSGVISAGESTPMAVTSNTVTIGLQLADESLAGMYGEKLIVAIIDPAQKGGYSRVVATDVVFENTTARTITINLSGPMEAESLVCLYRVPFVLSDDGRQAISTSTIYTDGSDMLAQLISVSGNVRKWGASILNGTQVFTRA